MNTKTDMKLETPSNENTIIWPKFLVSYKNYTCILTLLGYLSPNSANSTVFRIHTLGVFLCEVCQVYRFRIPILLTDI